MRKFLVLAALVTLFAGCESNRVIAGKTVPCVGIDRVGENTNYVYRTSTRNVIWAVVFSETIIVPVIVVIDELYCPEWQK
jgi:hypothetical protein